MKKFSAPKAVEALQNPPRARKQDKSHSWEAIKAKKDSLEALNAFRSEISQCRRFNGENFEGLFEDCDELLGNWKANEEKEEKSIICCDPLPSICEVLRTGMTQFREFAELFRKSSLCGHLVDAYLGRAEVINVFSALCQHSGYLAQLVTESHIYQTVLNRLGSTGQASQGNLRDADSWFMLSLINTCQHTQLPEVFDCVLRFLPHINDDNPFKRWISRMSAVFEHQRVQELIRSGFLRLRWMAFLEEICRWLESDKVLRIRGGLKLILSLTSARLIERSEADRLFLMPKVARCLLIRDETVHLGVCKVLSNLLYSELVPLTDLPVPFLIKFLRGFLGYTSAARKESAKFLIHNIIVVGSDSQLTEVFDYFLSLEYFHTLINQGREMPSRDVFLTSLTRLLNLVETDEAEREQKQRIINGIGSVLLYDDRGTLALRLLPCGNDFDPWTEVKNDEELARWHWDQVKVYFPALWPKGDAKDRVEHMRNHVKRKMCNSLRAESAILISDLTLHSFDEFKVFVSTTSQAIREASQQEQPIVSGELEKEIAAIWSSFLERVCELLDSGEAVIVRGSLKLLLSITASNLISKEEADSLILLPRVARCLLLDDELVHLGLCQLLSNLLSCELVALSDLPTAFVTGLVSVFLGKGASAERRKVICSLINNVVAVGSDGQLRAIFNKDLVRRYLAVLETIHGSDSLLKSLAKLSSLVKTSRKMKERIVSFVRGGHWERNQGTDVHLSLLPPEDNFDPWKVCVNSSVSVRWCYKMDGYFPNSWNPQSVTNSFSNFLSTGIAPSDSIEVVGNEYLTDSWQKIVGGIECMYFQRLLRVILSVGGSMTQWKVGSVLRHAKDIGKGFIVPLHWYEEMYNSVKDYCLKSEQVEKYPLLNGSSGIGKSTFVTYLVCRWLNDSTWYNNEGGKIDTIVIKHWQRNDICWGGFRKLGDRKLCFFELRDGSNPLRQKVDVIGSFAIDFDDNGAVWSRGFFFGGWFDPSTTLFIIDALQVDLLDNHPRFALGIASPGLMASRQGKSPHFEQIVNVPVPTDSDMGKIAWLLNGYEREMFRACFKTVGNDLRRCCETVETCETDIDSDLETVTVEEFQNDRLIRANTMRGVHHLLVKMVPVRKSPWKGFNSLRHCEVQFWSDFIMGKLAKVLFEIIQQQAQRLTDYFDSLSGAASRSFLGSLAESLFPEFIQKVSIKVSMMKMKLSRRVGLVSVKRDGEWNDVELFQAMEVGQLGKDMSGAVSGKYCYYKPSSSIQRMYDAIVMPKDDGGVINIIQITMGAAHSVASDEFEKLFDKFGGRKFRYLMIRVGSTKKEVEELLAKGMEWRFVTSRDDISVLRNEVGWFECVWNFEACLTEYLHVLTRPAVAPRVAPPVAPGAVNPEVPSSV
jgi:hypothetical protein